MTILSADHTGLQIPVSHGTFSRIKPYLQPISLAKVTPVPGGGDLVDLFSTLLNCGITNLGSEQSTTVTVSFMLLNVFRVLNTYSDVKLPSFKFRGNCSETGTSTKSLPARSRPDLIGTMSSATMYYAEDKTRDKLLDALKDLQGYVTGGLSKHHYGDLEFIFGHVASEPELQFVCITQNGEVG